MRHFLLPVWSRSHVYLIEDVVCILCVHPSLMKERKPLLFLGTVGFYRWNQVYASIWRPLNRRRLRHSFILVICRQCTLISRREKKRGWVQEMTSLRERRRRYKRIVGAVCSNRNTSPGSRFYFEPMLTLSLVVGSFLEEGGWEERQWFFFSSHAIYAEEAEAPRLI